MALFTSETAAQMAAKSHEARRQAKETRALILASPPQVAVELVRDGIQQRVERTRKQIELLDELIEATSDPDELDAYTRSKERLFRIWAHLAGIPGPGNLKPTAKPTVRREPIQPIACGPQAVAPATPPQEQQDKPSS